MTTEEVNRLQRSRALWRCELGHVSDIRPDDDELENGCAHRDLDGYCGAPWVEYAPVNQPPGAVAALVRIANTSPFDERWTHWREQAQAALAEMGVDPSTYRGQ